ncbi:MAG: ribosome recycling factor [Gemmatimonadetes bacterium]|nr:ribosome recycling factor [Gemmatimonadota bacterium]
MSSLPSARQNMEKGIETLRREFSGVRTGKASPTLLESVRVEAYGSHVPLSQVASVSAPEARLLIVQPWDRAVMGAIEKGIRESDLGLNPANDGKIIRVPIPALTEERRREYVKLLHKMAEDARVAVRQARKEGNDAVKARQKEGEISDDEARREQDEVQKLTNQYVERVDELLKHKEAEVMEV